MSRNPKTRSQGLFLFSMFKFWNFGFWEIDVMQNRGYRPDPKPPSPARAGTSREGGPYVFGAVSPVPDVFAKFQMQCSLTGPRCLCQTSIARLRRWLWHGAFGVERIPRRKYSSGEEAGDLRPATWRRDKDKRRKCLWKISHYDPLKVLQLKKTRNTQRKKYLLFPDLFRIYVGFISL